MPSLKHIWRLASIKQSAGRAGPHAEKGAEGKKKGSRRHPPPVASAVRSSAWEGPVRLHSVVGPRASEPPPVGIHITQGQCLCPSQNLCARCHRLRGTWHGVPCCQLLFVLFVGKWSQSMGDPPDTVSHPCIISSWKSNWDWGTEGICQVPLIPDPSGPTPRLPS